MCNMRLKGVELQKQSSVRLKRTTGNSHFCVCAPKMAKNNYDILHKHFRNYMQTKVIV